MADTYNESRITQEVPEGAVAKAEVVFFNDGSISVNGPAINYGEEYLAATLIMGLELLGYDVEATKNRDGVGSRVELTGVVDPEATVVARAVAVA